MKHANNVAATLFLLSSLTILSNAQASLGGSQASCDPVAAAFDYQGCFGDGQNGVHVSYQYQIAAGATGGPQSYPGFDPAILTIGACLTACRGHGFRYAALYSTNQCYCGTIVPTTQTLLSNPADNSTINECHVEPRTQFGCPGDRLNQFCGAAIASDVYGDPTFANVDLALEAANYQPLGCFTSLTPQTFFFGPFAVANTQACFSTCAASGLPYAGMVSATECQCGTSFEVGQAAQTSDCNTPCAPGE